MFDVAIVGGGVCGCSLLYTLSRYRVRAVLLEKTNDVGVATTKANSGIVHAGYDPEPGSKMARYNVAGNAMVRQLAKNLDILFRETGSLVVGFNGRDRAQVELLYRRGLQNGVPGLRILEGEALHAQEPGLAPEARFALYAPSAAVVNPWELAFAQAEAAVQGGAQVLLETEVQDMTAEDGHFMLQTNRGPVYARFVVNAAGIHAAQVAAMLGPPGFAIHPSRGEYYLMDKSQGSLVQHVVFQCPTEAGKGVLVAPTVHGNLIVGPNAEPAENTATTAEGLAFVREQALRSVPGVEFRQSIRNFAGLRGVADASDFIVGPDKNRPGLFHMAGIKSPGLSSAPAIAADMVQMLADAGLKLEENPGFVAQRRVLRLNHLDDAARAEAIRQNPLYGRIVCRCETVSEGEVLDALARPLPPRSLDAVKRRCGPGMGRCQGGFCGPRVLTLLAKARGVPETAIPQDDANSPVVLGRTKRRRKEAD